MSEAFKASGVITLTTDFGLQDPFVGVMKGSIITRFASARIIDLTHGIRAHSPAEAGFWLARSFEYFPHGTVHVAVVDPGVGTAREILVARAHDHVMLAPDNGLLAPLLAAEPDAQVIRVGPNELDRLGIARVSATFHGRDIFAPLAAELASGRCTPATLGAPAGTWVPSPVGEPQVRERSVAGNIVTIDHFGNLITNIDAQLIAALRRPRVHLGAHVFDVHRTYRDVQAGEYLALVNSFDVIEIARAERSAAEGLGLSRGAAVVVSEGTLEGVSAG
jgi:S-adenosylmethionine hydrolase